MAASGGWKREYERDWRDYTRRVLAGRFGKYAVQCAPSVTQEDEHQLRDVLAAAGIKHVPPNHSRWQAPIPASQPLSEPQDSLVSNGSYVYSTPPPPDSQSMFPAFSSQDFGSQPTSGRRVSASQRLQALMANVSPIADNRRLSVECVGTISPPLGAAKSPWTPGQWSPRPGGKKRRTPRRSLEPSFRAEDLDVSMQSMHLSDDERTQVEDEDAEAEDTQMLDVSEVRVDEEKAAAPKEGEMVVGEHNEECGGKVVEQRNVVVDLVSRHDDAEDMDVSKELIFSSDSEEDKDDDKEEQKDAVVVENMTDEGKVSTPAYVDTGDNSAHQSPPPEDTAERPPWSSEPDYEFGDGNDYAAYSQVHEQHDVEMDEVVQPTADSVVPAPESSQTTNFTRHPHRVVGKKIVICNAHGLLSTETSRHFSCGSIHQTNDFCFPDSFLSKENIPYVSSVIIGEAGTTNTANSFHDLKIRIVAEARKSRRRKSLAAKPGVFPYVVPELLVELQPYQKEALQWMLEREQDPRDPVTIDQQRRGEATAVDALVAKVCGGVLADEMGLGKTVCCLALICESLRQAREAEAQERRTTGSTVPRLTPPTLIVTPLSILSQWEQEIRAKTNLSVVTYQGATRKSFRSATQFMGADIVLSTYDTLRLLECKVRDKDSDDGGGNGVGESESVNSVDGWHQAPRLTPSSKKSVVTSKLHQLQWFRVILDESHLIANAGCARARAAFTLGSKRRWCVTGTPIQNRTADLAALLQFTGLGNRAHALSERELGALVPRVVLRRLKSTVDAVSNAPILELPEKTEEVVELDFASDVERALYMLLHRSTKRQVLRYLRSKEARQGRRVPLTTPTKDGGERPLFMHVFELILRLRQVCDACALVTADPLAAVQTRAASAEALVGNARDGISPFSAGETELLKSLQEQRVDGNAVSGCGPLESTKLTALMRELKKVRARRERVLVISQWTSFLDMIAERLEAHNAQCESVSSLEDASAVGNEAIAFAKLDGRMPAKDREQIVRNFQQQEDSYDMGPVVGPPLDVLLLSLRTGGLGLNLTAAAHVFIMEPSWNPSLERQAVDRAHRYGQTREVRVVRFIVKGSIEERVVALQNKKRQLTAAFLGDGDVLSTAKKSRLRETRLSTGDLRRLFFTQQEQEQEDIRQQNEDNGDHEAQRDEGEEDSDGSVTCIEISD
ncbi:hypothetical protein PF010_g5447 [Phytophthora fragariae]|uniref:Helicase n=1 Tax=Phytophthora fragariae TaxID=53985 RepID=A0A6G0LNX4_9STRA|nr:hypothetical protein PF010_g5447 [Phytophthora fragariae]